ncbi:MAG: 5-(carboxyamino)imidazole ribonucleotide mutase [Candidatus Azotimanducaceae bacterium]|jgi:5-(carboxyamino)imidazole ribonucleotide mutase
MKAPKVAIIMGSDSDFPIMKPAQQVLEELGIESETRIVSAHRMPDRMFEFAKQAESLGFNVIIAGAGGAAHLPGMVASLTVLPVVGVPVSATKLQGQDSLLSIVQMPAGIPVATVAIDNAKNAGILAAQIIGATDMSVRDRVRQWRDQLTADVQARADKFDPKMS